MRVLGMVLLAVALGAVVLVGPAIDDAAASRGASRALFANCPGNLGSLALPATPDCYGDYGQNGKSGLKSWAGNGLQVTVESFDGSRVVGTLRGTLAPTASHPTDQPVTIEDGSFSVIFQSF